jgi:hypothetical protein
VSACRSVLRWLESVSRQSVQRCSAWVWWSGWLEELANKESKENEARWRDRYGWSQSAQYFHFVSIWLPSGIVMTGHSWWISHFDMSTIPMTAVFSSSANDAFIQFILSYECGNTLFFVPSKQPCLLAWCSNRFLSFTLTYNTQPHLGYNKDFSDCRCYDVPLVRLGHFNFHIHQPASFSRFSTQKDTNPDFRERLLCTSAPSTH